MPSMKDEKDIINNNGDTRSDNFSSEDIYSRLNEASDMEDADEDLLALLDMISAQDEKQKNNNIQETVTKVAEKEPVKEEPESIFSMDDFNMAGEEPSHEEEATDSFAADKILAADSMDTSSKSKNLDNMGDVFSDALSAMDRLEDEELPESLGGVPKKKQGFFSRLFSKKDNKEKEKEPKAAAKTEKKTIKEEKAREKAKEKENKSKAAKAAAQDKNKNKKPAEPQLTEEEKAKIEKKKEAKVKKAADKAEKKKVTDAKKAEKKKAAADKAAIKQQKKQAKKELTPPDPDDNVKLNTLGVIFIMTFFILIAGVVIVGTKAYSYNLSVKSASIEYSRGRYTEAYYDIYGLSIRKQDYKTYDRIMTTMYVNKELNSYYNYMEMKKYPEALDSLLKGLNRYSVHIEHAKELGIEKNLGSIKKQMLKELKKSYGLTEKQASSINSIDDRAKYSVKVINTASEKFKK